MRLIRPPQLITARFPRPRFPLPRYSLPRYSLTLIAVVLLLTALALACGSEAEETATPPPTATATPAPTNTPPPPTATPVPPTPTPQPPAPTPTRMPAPDDRPAADASDAWFALDRVLDIAIEIDAADWDTLRLQGRTFDELMAEIERYNLSRPFASIYDWFAADVTVDGETYAQVGVRKKGFLGSQSETKPSLKLRFDKYVDDQSLGGAIERMTLNNSNQDPSLINTCLAYRVFAEAGLPSSRCNFATVSVNGDNLGLYIHVEEIKARFLARHFDSADGNLYEGTVSDFTPDYRGTFEKKTNEDAADWSDIDAVMAALQDPSPAGLQALSEIVDLDRFLTYWATESLAGHWDGYTGNRNNYHFYREPDGRFVFIPWGVDDVFHLKDDPNIFDGISNPPPSVLAWASIPNRLYNTPEWRARYAARLQELLDTVWNEAELLDYVDRLAAIVQQHALPENRAAAADDADRVRKFIHKRRGEILADLTPQPPDWPEPDDLSAGGVELESFELRFEAVWGTLQSANPLAEGTVYELNAAGEWVAAEGDTGATAGPADPATEAQIGVDDAAMITLMGLYPDGAIQGVTLWLPRASLSAGATLTIGEDAGVGATIWVIPPGGSEPQDFFPVTSGGIELTAAGTEPGDAVTGRLYANFDEFQVPSGAGREFGASGNFEAKFQTAWETSLNDDLPPGTVSYLAINDEPQPTATVGATIGPASPQEEAEFGLTDAALITILNIGLDGSIQGATLWFPEERLAPGAHLVIGQDAEVGGTLWSIPAGGGLGPEGFVPLSSGGIELIEAAAESGSIIVGSVYGVWGGGSDASAGGGEFGATGSLEANFRTAWETSLNDDLPPGTVSYLAINEEPQPTDTYGATVGPANPQEEADLGVTDAALINLWNIGSDGGLRGATFWFPQARLAPGARFVIGEDADVGGSLWSIPAGDFVPQGFVPLSGGVIELTQAAAESGSIIIGRVHGVWGGASMEMESGAATAAPGVGLVINEIAAQGDPLDWFELYNATDAAIDLSGYVVADDLADVGNRTAFAPGLTIGPGEYLRVEVDSDGWPGFALGRDEELGLWLADGTLVDSVDWDRGQADAGTSYARLPDGTGQFQATANPTPGAANPPNRLTP